MCLFGATAAIELPSLGGATILPSEAFLPFLLIRAWWERPVRSFGRVHRAVFWLALAVAWGLLSAVVIPRLLSGYVDVKTVNRTGGRDGTFPLQPVSGNITQTGYACAGLAAFLAIRA